MALTRASAATLAAIMIASSTASGQQTPFPDAHELPPAGWTGAVFKLSQAYPTSPPASQTHPWESIDFKTQPQSYMDAVLDYVYEGNIEVDFRVQDNAVRKWYHAPWMHWGPRGREFIHGMTRERTSRPKELAPTQVSQFQNWAVGFYNAPGGYTIGQVWEDHNDPDPTLCKFPNGTVTAKLLFTAATTTEVPFLENAFEWQANALKNLNGTDREPRMLKLLQLDVAVRDSRADATTGWVFGTFVYNNEHDGATPLRKMKPVGLMWGNDPGVTPDMVAGGTQLAESWINGNVSVEHYGWAGRLNGPVDNPISSCLSCHATAQIPSSSRMTFRNNETIAEKLRWFRNIKAGDPFDVGSTGTDYSLQIAFGIVNFRQSQTQPFEPLVNAFNAVQAAAPDEKSKADYGELLRRLEPAIEQPFTIDGKRYYPISRGD